MKTKQRVSSGTLVAPIATLALLVVLGSQARADTVSLGQASSFVVLAGTTVTNTGSSMVHGNVGVSTGTAATGFSPDTIVGGTMHSNDALAQEAQADLTTAYSVIAGEAFTQNRSGLDLGGITLNAGVYRFNSSAQLTGSLVLDGQGDANARFDFQIASTLTTASASMVTLINGASAENVYFQVSDSVTLGTGTVFKGNILALNSITLTTGASNCDGRVLARNGAVTLDTNIVGATVVPEENTVVLLGLALAMVGTAAHCSRFSRIRRKKKA